MAKPVRKLLGNQEVHLERPSATIYNHPLCFETLPSWLVPASVVSCDLEWDDFFWFFRNDLVLRLDKGNFRAIYLTPSIRQPFFQDMRITATLTRGNWKYRGLGRGWLRAKYFQASMRIWVQYPHKKTQVCLPSWHWESIDWSISGTHWLGSLPH